MLITENVRLKCEWRFSVSWLADGRVDCEQELRSSVPSFSEVSVSAAADIHH